MSDKFSLKWNDYQSNWRRSLSQLRKVTEFADVILVTDDKVKFSAHKILLSSCSNTFKFILKENTHANPIIYLSGVSSVNLSFILDYIYNGEVNLYQEQLDSFLDISEKLQIEGLLGSNQEDTSKESWDSKGNSSMKEKSPHEDDELMIMNTIAPVKTRRQATRTQIDDDKRMNVSSMTTEEVEAKIEELYQNTDGVWSCLTCGFTTVKRSNIKRHVEVHIDGLLYTCNVCHKEFRSKNVLNVHISSMHK